MLDGVTFRRVCATGDFEAPFTMARLSRDRTKWLYFFLGRTRQWLFKGPQ